MSRLAPIGHKHINMRGILTFDLARYRSTCFAKRLRSPKTRVELKKLTLPDITSCRTYLGATH